MNIQGKPQDKNVPDPALEAFRSGAPMTEVAKLSDASAQQQEGKAETTAQSATTQDNDAEYSAKDEIQRRALNQRISKTTRVSAYHNLCLRDYASDQTKLQGKKISEADVLEEALNEYFKKRKFVLK